MSKRDELIEALEWAANNGTTFEIIQEGENFRVAANRGRVTAEYDVDLDQPASLSGAVWCAIASVQAGTEYHRIHGHSPGLDPRTE